MFYKVSSHKAPTRYPRSSLVKTPVPGMSYILMSHWPKESNRTSCPHPHFKHHRPLPRLMVTFYNLIAEDNAYVIKHGEGKLVLNWRLYLCWLALIVLECALPITRRGKRINSLSYKPCHMQQWPACKIYWCNTGTNATGVTTYFLNCI